MPDTTQLTLEGEEQAILAIAGDDGSERIRIGAHFNNINDNRLAQQAGYRTAREYFAKLVKKLKGTSASNLRLYGSLARRFTEQDADTYGTTVLARFVTYMKLASYTPSMLAEAVVRIPTGDDAFVEKPLADCTERDLSDANRALRSPTKPLTEEDAQALEEYQSALDSVLGADHPSTIKAHPRNDETTVDFNGLPLKELPQVFSALDFAGPALSESDAQVVQMLADALEEARREGDDAMAVRARSRDGETRVTLADVPLSDLRKVIAAIDKRAAVVVP